MDEAERDRRGGARGRRRRGRADDRGPRPAVGGLRHRDGPPARTVPTRPGTRSRSRRGASSCCARSSRRCRSRSRRASGSTRWQISDRLLAPAGRRRGADGPGPLRRTVASARRSRRWPRRRTCAWRRTARSARSRCAPRVHFGWATPERLIQENFAEYDVPWRADLVHGWNLCEPGSFGFRADRDGHRHRSRLLRRTVPSESVPVDSRGSPLARAFDAQRRLRAAATLAKEILSMSYLAVRLNATTYPVEPAEGAQLAEAVQT